MRGVHPDGEKIRLARSAASMTQEEVAGIAQCNVKTIRKAEQGTNRLDLRVIAAIASAFETTVSQLTIPDRNVDHHGHLLQRMDQWIHHFAASDVEGFLSLHTQDSVLEMPGAEDLFTPANCNGIDQLLNHAVVFFKSFRLIELQQKLTHSYAAERFVFLRMTASIEYIPAGRSYTACHVHEFEFREDKISRRVSVADYGELRQIIKEHEYTQSTKP
ncbi:SnoaL-like domain protein [Rubripirellula obstinata]|uniref:SnoaL-like domain protein n=1 Tax=Rubripirellula obstinata TaxID=406547 RepID=A0A5B1CKQ1_9BACT|nr:nuclear transport factor 2 family protein [Rubripirellula obstinata]KAA1260455.1 SnoaL-like domain protein [Rubripirellula obstinata]